MSALRRYVDAWVAAEPNEIASAVTERCVVAECWGPVYRGRAIVLQWAEIWFGDGGLVHRWELNDHIHTSAFEAAAWSFEYTWHGRRDVIEGASIARTNDGVIDRLREFRTTAPAYDWTGDWR